MISNQGIGHENTIFYSRIPAIANSGENLIPNSGDDPLRDLPRSARLLTKKSREALPPGLIKQSPPLLIDQAVIYGRTQWIHVDGVR